MSERSLYERLGGEPALLAAVTSFYRRVLEDPLTRKYFERLDLEAQIRKQTAFMSWAFGGPALHGCRDLRVAHAALVRDGLGDRHFDGVLGHLRATLEDLGVAEDLIEEAIDVVRPTRDSVLGR